MFKNIYILQCQIELKHSKSNRCNISDIQVSVRQITQQSLVSRWYEMRAHSSQGLLSSD